MDYNEKIKNITNEISILEIKTLNDLNEIKVKYLGKKGIITELSLLMKDLDNDSKKDFGKNLNLLKTEFNNKIELIKFELEKEELDKKLINEKIDVTLPGTNINLGSSHILNKVIEEIEEIFVSMGYDIVDGPEIEKDLYNFEMLNLDKNHPARDTQDSFYIDTENLLRTQTSPVQVRTMLNNKEKSPIRIICPGKTYRKDNDDATHSHQFSQIEGLLVDENISLSHLKGTLEIFIKKMFGEETKIRFRPSYFPFTEPSLEVDMSCFNCTDGCNICKNTKWIEVLGAGMVHPNVLEKSGYSSKKYTGFAFGMGVERLAMLKYKITDIRNFYINDLRFLKQFNKTEGEL